MQWGAGVSAGIPGQCTCKLGGGARVVGNGRQECLAT